MTGQYCFVCASDEGVFLDVTSDNWATFDDQLITCLSAKVGDSIELSNKICYKCAYELDQCTKFVQKYKKSYEASKLTDETATICCLCFEFVESDRIFDLTKDNRAIFNPLQKIRNIFNEDFTNRNRHSKLVCLTCRYNLDVLYDLKRVYHETVINLKALIHKEIDYLSFPKVYTDVVNRKTTLTTFPDITFYGSINSDSESSEDMACNSHVKKRNVRGKMKIKLQNNELPKVRNCDHCCNIVAKGVDMYRFHRTGKTVCKNCWITMEPTRRKGRRRSQQNLADTKLCTVFLTDVLSDRSQKNERFHKNEYKIEKDKDGNKLYIVTDDSSLEEDGSSLESSRVSSSKSENRIAISNIKRGKKRQLDTGKSDIESASSKVTRLSQRRRERANTNETKSSIASSDAEQQVTVTRSVRKRKIVNNQNSDSDDSRNSQSDGSLMLKQAHRNKSEDHAKFSEENANNADRKKLKSILKGVTSNVCLELNDESSNEEKKRKTRNAKSVLPVDINKEIKNETRSKSKSSSISSTEPLTSSSEFKSPKIVASSEVKIEYTCDKCNKKFDNKLLSAEHKLVHLKKPVLKLEKVIISNIENKQETEIDSQENKISKEAESCSTETLFIDKHADDASEEIAINVEDDTDEEEIFIFPKNENDKKKKDVNDKNNSITDKSDATHVAENELCIEKESMKIPSNEITIKNEFGQCEESMIVLHESATTVETEKVKDIIDKSAKDENIKTLTSKDQDTDEQEVTVSIVENREDLGIEKDKDAEIENDTEATTIKKERSISESNNDKTNLSEETMCDNEMTKSSALPDLDITEKNKNFNESCQNELENSSKDSEGKTIDVRQCDLTNESPKEDTKELDEKEKTISDVTDTETLTETETLNYKDLEDTVIIGEDELLEDEILEKQQKADEQNIKTGEIMNVDTLDSAKDEDDIVVSVDSNNDTIKSIEVVKEIITDDLKEKIKLEEKIENIEELIEDNTMNNKCKKQENSNDASSSSPMDTANEILKEVFDLAAAEVQKREDSNNMKNLDDAEIETVENISREINNGADMPSLDPICIMEVDDDNDDVALN